MSWSRFVRDPEEACAALADPADALDLRARAALDGRWSALGFSELVPGELVRPVDVALTDLAATRRLGERLAESLRAGDLVVLSGPLGAGKTSLTQGLAAGLGVLGTVTSPTFVLARVHRGPLPLLHVDAYRLREAGARATELGDLDLEDALDDGVVVVEWGEGVVEDLAASRLQVVLSRQTESAGPLDAEQSGRSARVVVHGPRWAVLQRSARG